jgi:hypothetical protein
MPGPDYIHALLEGNNPSENPPTDPPWDELARLLLDAQQSDRPAVLNRWIAEQDGSVATEVMSDLIRFRNQEGDGDHNTDQSQTRIWSLDQFITEDFGPLPVLVGEDNNALLVAGEGMFIVGTKGAGKTSLCMDTALRMAAGLEVIGYHTTSPLSVLILQAELPASLYQHRFNRMVRGYECTNGSDFHESLMEITTRGGY